MFYVGGAVTVVWCILWFVLVTDYPEDHFWISKKELEHIKEHRIKPEKSSLHRFPILQMLTNIPVLSVIVCSLSNDYGFYILLTEGPSFMDNILKKDIATVGFLNSVPYLGRFITAQVAGAIGDALISRPHLISRLNVRRVSYAICLLGPACGLAAIGFVTYEWSLVIVIMTAGE